MPQSCSDAKRPQALWGRASARQRALCAVVGRVTLSASGTRRAASREVRAGATTARPAVGLGFADLWLEHVEILGLVCVGEVADGEEVSPDEVEATIACH